MSKKLAFTMGDMVVYPAHGVGKVNSIETQKVAGHELEVLVINFDYERMTLRLPVAKANVSGLRKLTSKKDMSEALKSLKKRGRVRRVMWSRRAQEYETKINSGNPESIAEVVRELYRHEGQPEQSYSERQLYQVAIKRLARELAAIESIDEIKAITKVEKVLSAA